MERSCGILLNISSLPSDFAIGDFNDKAIDAVIEGLKKMNFKRWQMLPLTISGEGNSPYSGISAFAGNPLYIDPYKLVRDGYIDDESVKCRVYNQQKYLVDYDEAKKCKEDILKISYDNCKVLILPTLKKFLKGKSWLNNYAMFMAAKKLNNSKCWALWDKDLRDRKNSALRKLKRENSDLYYYYVFEQFIFFKQYLEVKRKINKAGIKIIGDIPIYLAYDSVEVWSNPKEFLLDENKGPKLISAVPPDSFSKEGQLWKNPVYDYDYMEKNNFRFWLKRIAGAAKMYDIIRIDHFRGIYSYYATKPNAISAKRGKWYKGPGMKLIQAIKNKFPQKEFIAEDLGIIDEKVKIFRKQSGFSSTRVLQFAFESGNNEHLPQNYDDNCVAYTATHDNMTTMGFLQNSDNYVMKYIKNYCRIQSDDLDVILNDMITYLIASNAKTVIFPVQDLLHFGNDTRMNVPGKSDGNWVFRLTYEAWNSIDYSYFAWQNYVYSR